MNDDVVQVFRLEKVLKIVDLQHTARSLVDDLNASFPHDIFNVDYVQLEALCIWPSQPAIRDVMSGHAGS